MAVGQNQWHHFGVGAPPILVYFSGDWDVHWGYGLLTHGHMGVSFFESTACWVVLKGSQRETKPPSSFFWVGESPLKDTTILAIYVDSGKLNPGVYLGNQLEIPQDLSLPRQKVSPAKSPKARHNGNPPHPLRGNGVFLEERPRFASHPSTRHCRTL